jgi:hypothetical protein
MDPPLIEKAKISSELIDPPSNRGLLAIDTEDLNMAHPDRVHRLSREFDNFNDIVIDCLHTEAQPVGLHPADSRASIEKNGSVGNF